MKTIAILSLSVLAACATCAFPAQTKDDVGLVPPKDMIEFGIDAKGCVTFVEFHCPAGALPAAVLDAAEREMPGGQIVACEKEYEGGKVLWEVTKKIAGKEREVLFDAKGNVVEWEIEVEATAIAANVLAAGDAAAPGRRMAVEEIRNAKKELVGVHMKKQGPDGTRYKICLDPAGNVENVFRETIAEIEVPIR
jgi:hypothetical protein